jgi:hypothetical protein
MENGKKHLFTTQFTCFTGTKVQILTLRRCVAGKKHLDCKPLQWFPAKEERKITWHRYTSTHTGTNTGTKVQILTPADVAAQLLAGVRILSKKKNSGTKVQILTPARSSGAQPAQGVAEHRKACQAQKKKNGTKVQILTAERCGGAQPEQGVAEHRRACGVHRKKNGTKVQILTHARSGGAQPEQGVAEHRRACRAQPRGPLGPRGGGYLYIHIYMYIYG